MRTGGSRQVHELRLDGVPVADIEVASTFSRRFRGLMLRRRLPDGLLLVPERSVHGMWMREALDVAWVDADGTVLAVGVLHPWRVSPNVPGTHQVLESPVGRFAAWGLRVGSRVEVVPPVR